MAASVRAPEPLAPPASQAGISLSGLTRQHATASLQQAGQARPASCPAAYQDTHRSASASLIATPPDCLQRCTRVIPSCAAFCAGCCAVTQASGCPAESIQRLELASWRALTRAFSMFTRHGQSLKAVQAIAMCPQQQQQQQQPHKASQHCIAQQQGCLRAAPAPQSTLRDCFRLASLPLSQMF